MLKKFLRSKITIRIMAFLIYVYIKFTLLTSRIIYEKSAQMNKLVRQANEGEHNLIIAFWHGRLFAAPCFCSNISNIYSMISRHTDGEIIAQTVKLFGSNVIRGSTNRKNDGVKSAKDRGGSAALRSSIKALRANKILAITPDGPRGKRHIAKEGVVHIAANTGAVIVPVSFSATRCHIFKSWDGFMLPAPFSKIYINMAKPIEVPKRLAKEKREEIRKDIENSLNLITKEVDEICRK